MNVGFTPPTGDVATDRGYLRLVSVGQRIGIGAIGVVLILLGLACGYLVSSARGRRFARESLSELRFRGGSLGDPAGLAFGAIFLLISGVGTTAFAFAGA